MRLMPWLFALMVITPAIAGPLVGPEPGDLPDSPHPWRVWESQRRAAALDKAADTRWPGDPTPEQQLFDVTAYDLALDVDLDANEIAGTVTTTATVTGEAMTAMVLNFVDGMAVDAARAGGSDAVFTRGDHLLTVTLDRTYTAGETVTVAVDYRGDPSQFGSAFGWSFASARELVWSLSEPYGARTWWPCKDVNVDKADAVDMRVTIDDPWLVAGNGVLVGQESADGRTTFHWQSRYPIATYLVSLTAYPYVVFTDTYTALDGTTMPVENYVVPEYETEAREGYGLVPDMITAFREGYGEYPFLDEKYGHAHFTWGGGMEHQTCSSMIYWFHGEGLIAHELAHQWWGDLVTCADFGHIWLNEGFATWSEAYWREQNEGTAAYRDEMDLNKYFGGGTIFVEEPSGFGQIFNVDLSYNKASWVVHMLRGVLGDENFFAGLGLYRERFAYASATTEDLQAAMQDVSGRDLTAFFQQWIYGDGFPAYLFGYGLVPEAGGTEVHLRIEQGQVYDVFEMPIRVRLIHDLGWDDVVIENTRRVQNYIIDGPPGVTAVQLDPDEWILRTVTPDPLTSTPAAAGALAVSARPNPFNPQTTLRLTSPQSGQARLDLFDARGRLVRRLLEAEVPAGTLDLRWDGRDRTGRDVAAGVYLAVLIVGDERATTRLALVR